MPGKKIFASAQDVEAAFYEALEKADIESMMTLWSEDDEIVCVQPGGSRLVGYPLIREAWKRIFDSGHRLQVTLTPVTVVSTPFATVHSLVAQVRISGSNQVSAPLAVTNVFVRGAMGWRMVAHHASAVPPDTLAEASPKVLH